MTFEYQLPRDLESFQWGKPQDTRVLVQESTFLHTSPAPGTDYADTPPSRRKIWHYSLSDRGYTWFSLKQESNIIPLLQYWSARMEFRKEHGF